MLFSIVAVMLIICVFILAGNGAKKEAVSKEIRVGLFLYRGDDTFISTLRSCIEEIAYKRGFISREQLLKLAEPLMKTDYGKYMVEVANGL